MSSHVEAHVLARLRAAELIAEPFPHCVVDGAFPQEFFEDIVDYWPQASSFIPLSETGRTGDAYREREVILMKDENLRRIKSSFQDGGAP